MSTQTAPTTHEMTGCRALVVHNHRGDVLVRHVADDTGSGRATVRLAPRSGADLDDVTVGLEDGTLRVELPKPGNRGRGISLGAVNLRGGPSVQVEVEVPAGIAVEATTKIGSVALRGTSGDATVRTGAGEVRVERCLVLAATTGAGDLSVGSCTGGSATTGTGGVLVSSSEGELHARTGAGDLRVEAASGTVTASTGAGDIRLGLLAGSAECRSGAGSVTVTVPRGEPVWLDLSAGLGSVRKDVEPVGAPADGQPHLRVRARTGLGDVTVRHP